MHDLIDEGLKDDDELIRDFFVMRDDRPRDMDELPMDLDPESRHQSSVMSLMNGYGFIRFPDNNLFFLREDLVDIEFGDLRVGDMLEFNVAVNSRGQRVAKLIKRVEGDDSAN